VAQTLAEPEEPYSSFAAGTEPDVWPQLESPPSVAPQILIALLIALVAGLVWYIVKTEMKKTLRSMA
jgi:hypothetical protein